MFYNDKPRQSIFEYIESIECGLNKFRLLSLFGGINGFLEQIRIENNIAAPVPELRIEHSDNIQSEGAFCIYMTTGAINLCLNASGSPLKSTLGFEIPNNPFNYNLIGKTAVRWILAHEYYHIMYHDGYWNDHITGHALELDADMCATAIIYRAYQQMYGKIITDDRDLRCLVLYCLFSVLRSLPSDSGSGNHPTLAMRLRFIKSKLSSLRKNQKHRPDVLYQTKESHDAYSRLLMCLHNCEMIYIQSHPKHSHSSTLLKEIYEIELNYTFSEITQRWNEIAARIRPPLFESFYAPLE